MAATNFTDGSYLTPTIMNTLYSSTVGSGQGHAHDGVDADGHAQKINLSDAEMITGVIPLANVPKIPLSYAGVTGYLIQAQTTGMNFVDLTSAQSVTGIKGFGSDIYFKELQLHGASSDYRYTFAPKVVSYMPSSSYARSWAITTAAGLNEYHVGGYVQGSNGISGTYPIPITAFGCSAAAAAYGIDIAYIDSTSTYYGSLKMTVKNGSFTSRSGSNVNSNQALTSNQLSVGYNPDLVYIWFNDSSETAICRFQGVIREITASWS